MPEANYYPERTLSNLPMHEKSHMGHGAYVSLSRACACARCRMICQCSSSAEREQGGRRVCMRRSWRWPRNDHSQMCAPLCQVAPSNVVSIMIAYPPVKTMATSQLVQSRQKTQNDSISSSILILDGPTRSTMASESSTQNRPRRACLSGSAT